MTKKAYLKFKVTYPIESSHLNLKFMEYEEVEDLVTQMNNSVPVFTNCTNTTSLVNGTNITRTDCRNYTDFLDKNFVFHPLIQRLKLKVEVSTYTYVSLGYFGLTSAITKIGGFNAATFSVFNITFGSLFSAMFLRKIGEKLAK